MILIKKILVPTDLSDSSMPAIGYALSLAKKHDAEVRVLHVLSPQALSENFAPGSIAEGLVEPGAATGGTLASRMDRLLERKQRVVHDFLQPIGPDLLQGVKIKVLLRLGKPVREILAAAKEEQADLLVMTRRSGLSLRGHVTDRIVKQAPCPVLSLQPFAEIRTGENERVPLNLVEKWAA
jgi:nucleotide-binding universal stress UspA family protein